MKAIIEPTKLFTPFNLILTVETPEEARLLYHIFNRGNLKRDLFGVEGYSLKLYNKNIAANLCNHNIESLIERHLTKMEEKI